MRAVHVNHDVLTMVFSYLSTDDLVSACQVNRAFQLGATPSLYRAVWFRLGNLKRWPRVASPFTAIVDRPRLGVHVRSCEIDVVPRLKGEPHPLFIAACAQSLGFCPNMRSFKHTHDVPPFLSALAAMPRLTDLKIHAALASEQARALVGVRGLQCVALHQASWNFCNTLPDWVPTLAPTLSSLTLAHSRYLNEAVLTAILPLLPTLRGLHVVGCAQVSHTAVLRLVAHTPRLESLSLTTWENCSTAPIAPAPVLLYLRHLAVDTRCALAPHAVPELYDALLTAFAPCPLASLTFKFSERLLLADEIIAALSDGHEATITCLNVVNANLSEESIHRICVACSALEQLAVVVPIKDMMDFLDAMSYAWNLRTLIDVGDSHTVHGRRPILSPSDVRDIFQNAGALRTVISGNRCWTCERVPLVPTDVESMGDEDDVDVDGENGPQDYDVRLKLARLRTSARPAYDILDGQY